MFAISKKPKKQTENNIQQPPNPQVEHSHTVNLTEKPSEGIIEEQLENTSKIRKIAVKYFQKLKAHNSRFFSAISTHMMTLYEKLRSNFNDQEENIVNV
ncbi:hypothetical protein NUSPORA_01301 [Nucleospora cyclopteri]